MRPALILLLALSCNAYDPNLGDTPFICGGEEPRCPDGYLPVDVSDVRCECHRASSVKDGGVGYECNGDQQEPNDSVARAWETPVGELNPSVSYDVAAICPTIDDEDYFKLAVPRRGTIIRVDLMFDITRQAPDVSILNADGQNVMAATESPTPGMLVTTYTAMAVDAYYVRVRGTQTVNYKVVQLRIIVPGL